MIRSRLSSLEGVGNEVEESTAPAGCAVCGAGRVFAGGVRFGFSPVACSTSANVVDGPLLIHLLLAAGLALQLLIKGEDSSLGVGVDIACSSSARAKLGTGLGELGAEERGWAFGGAWAGGLGSFEGVACSSTAGVDVGARGWVRLGDLIV